MKKALNRLGLYAPLDKTGITGIADTAMFDALKQFQTMRGLKPNGIVKPDDETIAALNSEISVTPTGSYVWRSVEDAKVRGAHAAFNRTIRFWADSPDPGEDYNCRCWAESLPPDEPGLGAVYPEIVFVPALSAAIRVTVPVISGAISAVGTRFSREAIKRAVNNLKDKSIRDTAWVLGWHKTDVKWQNRMKRGGWTNERITDTIRNGESFPAPNKVNNNNTATRYEKDGNFVVRDDRTHEILQLGKPDFQRNIN